MIMKSCHGSHVIRGHDHDLPTNHTSGGWSWGLTDFLCANSRFASYKRPISGTHRRRTGYYPFLWKQRFYAMSALILDMWIQVCIVCTERIRCPYSDLHHSCHANYRDRKFCWRNFYRASQFSVYFSFDLFYFISSYTLVVIWHPLIFKYPEILKFWLLSKLPYIIVNRSPSCPCYPLLLSTAPS